jgi:SAM-dependent methyltransferase
MTVEPFRLQRVKEEHINGVFGDFTAVIDARIEALKKENARANAEQIRFWEFALDNLDPVIHAMIQRKYLVQGGKIRLSGLDGEEALRPGMVKYIDPVTWLESKVRLCRKIELHRSSPLSILDIGTGPGHFPFVARFYGHDVVGLDVPEEVNEEGETFLYDDLCKLYGVSRIAFNIKPGCQLPHIGKGYDLVTSFLTAFNKLTKPDDPSELIRYWTPYEWGDFIDACCRVWLRPGGRIIMTLDRNKITKDCWDYLAARAAKADPDTRFIEIHSPFLAKVD